MKDLPSIRKEYQKATLDERSIAVSPIEQFDRWFNEAVDAQLPEPTAMNLATVNNQGRPTSRIVLLKGVEDEKFIFYTNYQSTKGRDLEANPACALHFFWPELERQIRIEGTAQRIDEKRSALYFQSRPRTSQIGAWASPQSSFIKNREMLEERAKLIEKRFETQNTLPKPHQWGGYEVEPLSFEFWQGRESRLHDRILYLRVDNTWQIHRLAP